LGEAAELKLAADYSDMEGPALVFTRDDLDGIAPSPFLPAPPEPGDLYEPTGNESDVFTDKEIWGGIRSIERPWEENLKVQLLRFCELPPEWFDT
jgi:hypothetical protein